MESISNVAAIGSGGNSDNETINFEDFESLSQEEKDNGTAYYIPDANILTSFSVVGNRFDKANIYTTTEKMIGSYMGKPLYQKTINCGALPNNTVKNVDVGTSDIIVVSMKGIAINPNNYDLPLPYTGLDASASPTDTSVREREIAIHYSESLHSIIIRTYTDRSNWTTTYITIQYTKNSDGTVRVGTGNDYSTEEQIVGTWVDGKPIYQKTVPVTITVDTDSTSTTSYAGVSALNIDNIVDMRGMLFQGSAPSSAQTPLVFSSWVNSDVRVKYIVQPWFNKDDNRLCIDCNRLSYSGKIAYITIQYTKTTD